LKLISQVTCQAARQTGRTHSSSLAATVSPHRPLSIRGQKRSREFEPVSFTMSPCPQDHGRIVTEQHLQLHLSLYLKA